MKCAFHLPAEIHVAWLAAMLFSAGWPLAAQQVPPSSEDLRHFTITADVELVLLDVSVRDPKGGFVSGLDKSAFSILEDGKPQPITQFANQDVPVTLGLVIDNSGSMRVKKPDVITAALVLVQASNPQDEVFVINFNDTVRRGLPDIVPFTDDVAMLREALSRDDPAGRTSLYDGLIAALQQLDMGRRDKKTLVVVSDGGDNASTHTLDEVLKAALESRATIYTVGIFDDDDKDKNPDVLKRLANLTGGVYYRPRKVQEVVDITRQISKDIRTRYTMGFIPQHTERPGQRRIRVQVQSPTGERLSARTRTHYAVADRTGTSDRQAGGKK
jgi:Ca-activated chloride channel homolog